MREINTRNPPNPRPDSSAAASTRPARAGTGGADRSPGPTGSPGSREMSTIAPSAATAPRRATTDGRSPLARPNTRGTRAEVRAETGATTLIWPAAMAQ